MQLPVDLSPLLHQYDGPGVRAFVLMGSYARGDAGPHSDVDLVRFVDETVTATDAHTHLLDGRLVVVSTVTPAKVVAWFTEPEAATSSIAGVRVARVLLDREATFAAIQAQAIHFTWSEEMQQKANHWASEMMVGLIEETHKGLEGLRRHDGSADPSSQSVGRLLNARFGLSWLLSNVIRVQRGVLISGDNIFYAETAAAIGTASEWVRLRRIAFGLEDAQGRAPTLRQQVEAGLHLYVETARLLAGTFRPNDEPLIHQTVERIQRTLAAQSQSLANENRRNV